MWDRIPPELRRYLWIEGRSSRREWWRIEFLAIASYWFVGNGALVLSMLHDQPPLLPTPVRLLLAALMLWINIASTVRRLHDRNKSGRWALLYLFPLFGQVWHFIECGLLPPRDQGNRYGPRPQESPSPVDRLSASLHQLLNPNAMQPMTPRETTRPEPIPAAPATRASARGARGPRTIGPVRVSAVNRTRSQGKLILAIAAAIAIVVLGSSLGIVRVAEVGVPRDAPVLVE